MSIKLRELVRSIDPHVCEIVRLGDRAITFGLGPKKISEGYAFILPYTNWVNLGFYRGVDLPDPMKLLEGSGAKMRHIKMDSVSACERDGVADLVRAALAERASALGST